VQNKEKLKLKPKGYLGATEYQLFDSYARINFLFKGGLGDDEMFVNFSEINILNFVADSYKCSCLTLFLKLREYVNVKTLAGTIYCAYRYLPAMFCFRHYIELRLKCFYMKQNREFCEVCNGHNLTEICNKIKEKGFSLKAIKQAIEYVNNIEKNDETFFRYLISPSYNCSKNIKIEMLEYDKIRGIITEIEKEYELCETR